MLDELRLPGIAVLLVALMETSTEATVSISVERYADWCGFSERSAERGVPASWPTPTCPGAHSR